MKLPTLCIAASFFLTLAGQANAQTARTQPSTGLGQLTYKVGQRVDYVEDGKWFKAVITEVRDDSADHLDRKI